MDVLDAAYATVHDYPGGATALAPRAGFSSPHVLNSKVRPGCDTHHLTLAEANKLMDLTGDHRILRAMTDQHGYLLVPVQIDENPSNVLASILDMDAASGDLAREIRSAMADGVITERELRGISKHGDQVQATLLLALRKLRSVAAKTPGVRSHA